jgi:hypothetical protein
MINLTDLPAGEKDSPAKEDKLYNLMKTKNPDV